MAIAVAQSVNIITHWPWKNKYLVLHKIKAKILRSSIDQYPEWILYFRYITSVQTKIDLSVDLELKILWKYNSLGYYQKRFSFLFILRGMIKQNVLCLNISTNPTITFSFNSLKKFHFPWILWQIAVFGKCT